MTDEEILTLADGLPMALFLMGQAEFVPSDYEKMLLDFGREVAARVREEVRELRSKDEPPID